MKSALYTHKIVMAGPYEIRQLSAHADLADAVRLQQEIWGFEDVDLLPHRMFVVATKIGGQVLGAYDRNEMIAFCLGIPGLKPTGKPYLHSHMLGVRAEYRNSGLGHALKLRQREYCLACNLDLIEWTFDPFETKNAFFNTERLGAIARRYVRNQYGMTSSPLHSGLPTDRLIAEWWIRESKAQNTPSRRIVVPAERTAESQEQLAEELEKAFAEGLAITGFDRSAGAYLLSAKA